MPLCLDFLSVFEGEPYIVLAEDGDEVHQPTPKGSIEFIYQVSLRQGSQKGFDGSPSGLFVADCLVQGFISSLGCVEPFRQPIIAFFVFHLVECDMSVDSYESLLNIVMK